MEQAKDNYAMLRDPVKSFRTSPDDIYLGGNLIKPLHLRVGQQIKVRLRKLRPHDKYLSAASVISVEDIPAEDYRAILNASPPSSPRNASFWKTRGSIPPPCAYWTS